LPVILADPAEPAGDHGDMKVLAVRPDDVAGGVQRPLPDGLIRTELLEGLSGEWKIQSLWRDRAALDAMRAGPEPPTAPALFRQLSVEPELRIYSLQARHTASP
jgi:hypothetical protein